MTNFKRLASFPAIFAAVAMAATPVEAAELPVQTGSSDYAPSQAWGQDAQTVQHNRGWRGYRGYRGHRHRNRIGVGDVIAGAVIIGGIAAIANAASKNDNRRYRDTRYRDRDYRYRDRNYRYDNRRGDSRRYQAANGGIDNAVSICVTEIERDVRVENVDSVSRTGNGWQVSGALYNGEPFTCRIDGNGRLDRVDYGIRGAGYAPVDDRQYNDARYRSAWANVDAQRAAGSSPAVADNEPVPAYPGGPIDGDLER